METAKSPVGVRELGQTCQTPQSPTYCPTESQNPRDLDNLDGHRDQVADHQLFVGNQLIDKADRHGLRQTSHQQDIANVHQSNLILDKTPSSPQSINIFESKVARSFKRSQLGQ